MDGCDLSSDSLDIGTRDVVDSLGCADDCLPADEDSMVVLVVGVGRVQACRVGVRFAIAFIAIQLLAIRKLIGSSPNMLRISSAKLMPRSFMQSSTITTLTQQERTTHIQPLLKSGWQKHVSRDAIEKEFIFTDFTSVPPTNAGIWIHDKDRNHRRKDEPPPGMVQCL
jgi:hypothetical protein